MHHLHDARDFLSIEVFEKTKSKKDGTDYAKIISEGISSILFQNKDTVYEKITNTKQLDVTLKKSADENEYNAIITYAQENGITDLILTSSKPMF